MSSITIANGVASIGDRAFSYCMELTSITIPASVMTIGNYVFYNSLNLASIDVAIGSNTFASEDGVLFNNGKTILICCPAAKTGDYVIPSSVINIKGSAFNSCRNLTSITIPNTVSSIEDGAFTWTKLTSFQVSNDNVAYSSENGVLFDKAKTKLIQYPSGKTDATYNVPNSVMTLGTSYTFANCTHLTSVIIPESVTTMGMGTFYGCTDLISVIIPNSVRSMGNYTFNGCNNLTSVAIPNSITQLAGWDFGYCSSMQSITIPNSVTSIGYATFYSCLGLNEIINHNKIPADLGDLVFNEIDKSACILKVPTSAVSAYQNAEIWNEFNIVGGGILVNPRANNNIYGYTIGNGLYNINATATVIATSRTGYKFTNWTKNGVEVSTVNSYSFTVTEDVELIANFEEEEVGIGTIETAKIKIYPNPTNDTFFIESENFSTLKLYDMLGKEVINQNIIGKSKINISHLPKGIYNINVISEGKVIGNSKIVKQ